VPWHQPEAHVLSPPCVAEATGQGGGLVPAQVLFASGVDADGHREILDARAPGASDLKRSSLWLGLLEGSRVALVWPYSGWGESHGKRRLWLL
jgi:hypothetical protein